MQVRLPRYQATAAAVIGALLLLFGFLAAPAPARAATFTPTTPAELIAAITTANSNGQDDVIDLGGQTFTLTATNNTVSGANGLPSLLADGGHALTIRNGTIERQAAAPGFRLVHVSGGATVTFDSLTLRNGRASAAGLGTLGGAILTESATVSITNSRFGNNTAVGSSGLGGAIFNNQSTLNVSNTIFSGNTGEGGGGGLYAYSPAGATVIVNSIFDNNSSNAFGAGLSIENATVTISNSTISNNAATGLGGAVYALGGSLTLSHSTLSGNSATTGGGLYNEPLGSGVMTLRATILDTGATGANCSGAIGSLGSNLSDDGSCGFTQPGDVNNATLNLGPLQDNGGPTHAHALLAGSAAIDAVQSFCTADGTFGGAAISTDQRGAVRPKGSACDAGAFESGTLTHGSLQFSAPTFTVGEAGPTASVTVTRTGGSDFSVGATVTLANGTATAPADYDNTAHTVSFAPGDTAPKTVSIPLVDDALDEPDETITLTLGSPTGGATLGAQTAATLTITDNDLPPTLSIDDVTLAEGDAGSTAFVFTVTLSAAGGQQVTVQAQTADGSATAAGGDYAATGPTTLTFVPGDTSESFTVQVTGNTTYEPAKTFVANLTNATNATILDNQGIGTISNDDDLPVFSIANITAPEGNSGTSTALFTVSRTGATTVTASVQYATADGSARAGTDYAATNGTLTFAPNESSKTIAVQILGDTLVEPDETFTVTLSNPTNATLGTAQAVGTISNDDVGACTPRPRVTQSLTADGSVLTVHVEATPLNTQANNPLQQIRFGTFQNATVRVNGHPVNSGQTIAMPANTFAADFVVRRVTPGQPTTVPFTVVDGCGEWNTFVGGGTGAGF